MVPGIANLIRLLRVAETPKEAAPIWDALKAQGFDPPPAGVQAYGPSFPEFAPITHNVAPLTTPVSGDSHRIAITEGSDSSDKGSS
jgi:hypothetical protein